MEKVYNRISLIVYAIEENRVISSIKRGLMLLLPVLMVGSIAVMLNNIPIAAYQNFLTNAFGGLLRTIILTVYSATFEWISVYLILSVSYYYSHSFARGDAPQILSMITSFACFIASFGITGVTKADFSATGAFTAMLCAILGTLLYHKLYAAYIRIFKGNKTYSAGADYRFRIVISSILPFAISVLVFVVINLLIDFFFDATSINELIANFLSWIFSGIKSGLGGGILYVFIVGVLWFFGIHGSNAMKNVSDNVFEVTNTDPDVIMSKTFIDTFSSIGGVGTAICLILAILLFSKSKTDKQLARSATPMAIFNISEMLTFGLPIILNPILLIPFILVPIVSLSIGYVATLIGIIPIMETAEVGWTLPALFSGYVATGKIAGIIVQIVIIAVGTAIYAPFVRISDKIEAQSERRNIDRITDVIKENEAKNTVPYLLNRPDSIGSLAKAMASKLRDDISKKQITMFYQPQADKKGFIIGAEALLRWKYGDKMMYPPLVVALANEEGIYDQLTNLIIETVITDTKRMKLEISPNVKISINITANQLNNRSFVNEVLRETQENKVDKNICLEVLEDVALENLDNVSSHVKILTEAGIRVSIDDFSMGQTSIKYLQENSFSFVKLGGELVKMTPGNSRVSDIIRSITELGSRLGFEVVAEYVETEEQLEELKELGCDYFQGYYYSPGVPLDTFIDFTVIRNEVYSENNK